MSESRCDFHAFGVLPCRRPAGHEGSHLSHFEDWPPAPPSAAVMTEQFIRQVDPRALKAEMVRQIERGVRVFEVEQ